MTRIVLKGWVDRPGGDLTTPDPHPDFVALTTRDPSLDDLLEVVDKFIKALGYVQPGHLTYTDMEDDDAPH